MINGWRSILLLTLLLGGCTTNITNPFVDVSKDLNSYEAITGLKDEGWIVGVGNNEFKPFDTITRVQMAVLICKAEYGVRYKPPVPIGSIPDVSALYWGAGWIESAINAELMDLYEDGNFYPRNPAIRADGAVLLWEAK